MPTGSGSPRASSGKSKRSDSVLSMLQAGRSSRRVNHAALSLRAALYHWQWLAVTVLLASALLAATSDKAEAAIKPDQREPPT